jgi:hypothetical protein
MIENLLDPIIFFFIFGILAGVLKSDLKTPEALYEVLSIYLLLAIGLKGGVELNDSKFFDIIFPILGTFLLGILIPLISFKILYSIGKFNRANSAGIAAHYGSVSAVTFAVVLSYLTRLEIPYEGVVTVLLVVLEIPAIGVGILLAKMGNSKEKLRWKSAVREVILGKSIFLLLTGLIIGLIVGGEKVEAISPLFFDLFKGALALFLMEMGLVASRRLADLKKVGFFLLGFGILMPLLSAVIATFIGYASGLSVGGSTVLATLGASASYIAAPAAVRIAIPKANPTYYLTASLGITFPFNIIFGIPLYLWLNETIYNLL